MLIRKHYYFMLLGLALLGACIKPATEKLQRETAAYALTLHVMDSTSKTELNALKNCRSFCQQILLKGIHPANGQACDKILHTTIDSLDQLEQDWPLADERLEMLKMRWAALEAGEGHGESFESMLQSLDSVQVLMEKRSNTLSSAVQQSSACLGLLPN